MFNGSFSPALPNAPKRLVSEHKSVKRCLTLNGRDWTPGWRCPLCLESSCSVSQTLCCTLWLKPDAETQNTDSSELNKHSLCQSAVKIRTTPAWNYDALILQPQSIKPHAGLKTTEDQREPKECVKSCKNHTGRWWIWSEEQQMHHVCLHWLVHWDTMQNYSVILIPYNGGRQGWACLYRAPEAFEENR